MFARRANLANCGFMVNMQRADATFGVRRQHASCVRNTAEESLVRARFFSPELAKQCVDRVFDRCYRNEDSAEYFFRYFSFLAFGANEKENIRIFQVS